MSFGKKLRELRKQYFKFQSAFAAEIEHSVSAISQWENGKRLPQKLQPVIDAFKRAGATSEQLYGLVDVYRQEAVIRIRRRLAGSGMQLTPLASHQGRENGFRSSARRGAA